MLNPAATAYSNRPNGKILEKRARKWIATIGETEETKFNAEDKKAASLGGGVRSGLIWKARLGGGVPRFEFSFWEEE
ncbi:hypothetical protein HED51_12910 [Ochrobactrum grignonense]|nr:hypothetical protein [Brucella grignonensis]